MSNAPQKWERPKPISFLGNYIDGQFTIPSEPDYKHSKVSPADFSDHLSESEILSCKSHVDEVVLAAKRAYDFWSKLDFEKRADLLMKLKSLYQVHKEDIAQIISREMGKPLWESQTEAQGMISKIDITLNYSIELIKDQYVEGLPLSIKGRTSYKPRGVMAVIWTLQFSRSSSKWQHYPCTGCWQYSYLQTIRTHSIDRAVNGSVICSSWLS